MRFPCEELSDVCEIIMGQAPAGDAYNDKEEGYPLVAGAGDFGPLYPSVKKHTTVASKLSRAGDIILGIRASIGSKVLSDKEYCLGRGVAGLRASPRIDNRYLWHWLEEVRMELLSKGRGATFLQVNRQDIRELQIPLPPLAEQKRIAAILDAADALRAKRRESLAQLDALLQSTFLTLFGDPITNPKGWEMKNLKEISTHIMSGNTPKGGKEVYVEKGVLFFRSQNVWKNRLDLDDIAYIDEKTHLSMKKSSLKSKDILITKTGRVNTENSSLGRAAIFLGPDNSANINGHVYLVRLKEKNIHRFVLFILTTKQYREYIRRTCVGGIDKRQINKEHLEDFPIIFPPLPLQQKFAAIVESVERQKAAQRAHLAELDALFAALQHRAFRGEL